MNLEGKLNIKLPSSIHTLELALSKSAVHKMPQVWCKRDDLIHPVISGNKWRKLAPNIERLLKYSMHSDKKLHIASFGGAYSNHLHALAYVCTKLNIQLTALVRAHVNSPLSPTLKDIKRWGAQLQFLSREDYKKRTSGAFLATLHDELKVDAIIEEGGSNTHSLLGVGNIVDELIKQCAEQGVKGGFDSIVLPVASGGTMAGLIQRIGELGIDTKVIGIAVLKGEGYLESSVKALLSANTKASSNSNWQILHRDEFHAGGYAKSSEKLANFALNFERHSRFALDKVYNQKSFYALNQLLSTDSHLLGQKICILNTGGMQGNREKTE